MGPGIMPYVGSRPFCLLLSGVVQGAMQQLQQESNLVWTLCPATIKAVLRPCKAFFAGPVWQGMLTVQHLTAGQVGGMPDMPSACPSINCVWIEQLAQVGQDMPSGLSHARTECKGTACICRQAGNHSMLFSECVHGGGSQ
jgi:hypothetical protein